MIDKRPKDASVGLQNFVQRQLLSQLIHPFESHLKTGGKANRDFPQTLPNFEHARRGDRGLRPTVIAAIEGWSSQKEWTPAELNALGERCRNYADISPADQEKLDRNLHRRFERGKTWGSEMPLL